MTLKDRFDAKWVAVESGCWEWQACVANTGYGQIRVDGKTVTAHRIAYELYVDPIPSGLQIDHLCRNRRCVNPAHLEAVTQRVNLLRGDSFSAKHAVATECPQGHPYDEENTYVDPNGGRACRTCRNEASARYKARKRKHMEANKDG